MNRILVDTNVLVYAYDLSEPTKQLQAIELLDELVRCRQGVISTQVVSEFFSAVTRKIGQPLSLEEAKESVHNYLFSWDVLSLDRTILLGAVAGTCEHRLNYWDALIWATARVHQIGIIFSEDFNSGMVLEGVRFVNPFAESFQLEEWLVSE
jgi:predicted nucleic acid-binding protein